METLDTLNTENDTIDASKKQRLLSDETYQSLMNTQETIFSETGIRVPLRKIIDKLVTTEAMNHITTTFIQKLNF